MKTKYLLTLALAGMLVFGTAPVTANAASPTAGGTIVDGDQGDAGDVLDLDEDGLPLDEGQGNADETEVAEDDTPLAVLSTETKTANPVRTVVIVVGSVAAVAVVGTGIAVATGVIGAGAAGAAGAAGSAGAAGATGAKSGMSWLKSLFKKRK